MAKYLPLSVEMADAIAIDHDGGTTTDFAAFAMHPESGAVIDGKVSDDEVATESAARPDDMAEGQPGGAANPDATAAADEITKTKPAKKKDAKDEGRDPMVQKYRPLIDEIIATMTDGAPPHATRDFYADGIEAMHTDAPELHAELMEHFVAFESEADDQ